MYHTIKTYGGVKIKLHALLGNRVFSSILWPSSPWEKSYLYYCTAGWVGPQASLEMVAYRKIPTSALHICNGHYMDICFTVKLSLQMNSSSNKCRTTATHSKALKH